MDFKQLRYYVAVVSAGNISKAADAICITQPALTRSIQALEHEVGETLLRRLQTGIVPTDAGWFFFEHANRILNEWIHVKSEISARKLKTAGHLRVGVAPLFSHGFMDHVLTDLDLAEPSATIAILQGPFMELREWLLSGECDVLLTTFPTDKTEYSLDFQKCMAIRAGILASANHPLVGKENLSKEDLQSASWALFSRTSHDVNRHLAENEISVPTPDVSTNSLSLLIKRLKSCDFLTSLAPIVLLDEIRAQEVMVLQSPLSSNAREAGMVFLKDMQRKPLMKTFADCVLKTCDGLSSEPWFFADA